jgi:hypothetical protein
MNKNKYKCVRSKEEMATINSGDFVRVTRPHRLPEWLMFYSITEPESLDGFVKFSENQSFIFASKRKHLQYNSQGIVLDPKHDMLFIYAQGDRVYEDLKRFARDI